MAPKKETFYNMEVTYEGGCPLAFTLNERILLNKIFAFPVKCINYGRDASCDWVKAKSRCDVTCMEMNKDRVEELVVELVNLRQTGEWFANIATNDSGVIHWDGDFSKKTSLKRPRSEPVPACDDDNFSAVCPEITAETLREKRQTKEDRALTLEIMLKHLNSLNDKGQTSCSSGTQLTVPYMSINPYCAQERIIAWEAWIAFKPELERRGFAVNETECTISWA